MGLMDILNGMQNGPRGGGSPAPAGQQAGGGLSPIMTALLGLLAYKAVQGGGFGGMFGGGQQQPGAPQQQPGGGLGDILGGLFGGSRQPQAPAGGGGLG